MSTLEYVTSRLGTVKPETKSIAAELYNVAKAAGHDIWFMWGMGTSAEHKTGLALDLMVRNEAAGDYIRDYIWANRQRLRLRHVIWEQHITSTVVNPGVRTRMEDRGDPTANHYDHIHTWHFAGSYQAPTDATPAPAPTTPEPVTVYKKGSRGETVKHIQEFLYKNFPLYRHWVKVRIGYMIVIDGDFGMQTEAWVKEFQKRTNLVADGIVGPVTLAEMRRRGYKY